MAREAGFIDRWLAYQGIAGAGPAVRVVTVTAGELVFAHGMGGEFEQVGTHVPVTTEAPLRLPGLGAYPVDPVVNSVTVGAGEIGLLMGAAGPSGRGRNPRDTPDRSDSADRPTRCAAHRN